MEWGKNISYSHDYSASGRVAKTKPHNFDVIVTDVTHDNDGHLLLLDCTREGDNFILVNIDARTKDRISMQN